jgi:hypothetical protein
VEPGQKSCYTNHLIAVETIGHDTSSAKHELI